MGWHRGIFIAIKDDQSSLSPLHTATREFNEALDQVLEFWANGTAVHAESLAAKDLIEAVKSARREGK